MIQRIPHGRIPTPEPGQGRPVAFLMTGVLSSSADFVVNLPDQSLGFILADHGFDVWLGNVRGTIYSNHVRLKKQQKEFWDFSFDEMIKYHLPAQIDMILKETKKNSLLYTRFPVYMANDPAGSSVRNMFHIAQKEPPQYDVRKVTAPVALYWSDGDVLACTQDVRHLRSLLPNVVLDYKVPVRGFTHIDFAWSIFAKNHLYKMILQMMIAYSRMEPRVPVIH
ncbi:hypothetical protein HPB52_016154 [Rhipicephalus sanguineus]|uniref:Uncharacterized protein n=1 Tax=Rhipicephalus sanguineus TaxID=34632 RepID=A0A9D4PMV0_RHISA|nr:hypothetical protein HPB52_016154 [Rhipicephalus sanguineus]